MENFILGGILLLIIGIAAFYVIRAKRRGKRCIGCPYADNCRGDCACSEKNQTSAKDEEK